jgi:hypothetical protein
MKTMSMMVIVIEVADGQWPIYFGSYINMDWGDYVVCQWSKPQTMMFDLKLNFTRWKNLQLILSPYWMFVHDYVWVA